MGNIIENSTSSTENTSTDTNETIGNNSINNKNNTDNLTNGSCLIGYHLALEDKNCYKIECGNGILTSDKICDEANKID